jgi:magnesium chelatase family protein
VLAARQRQLERQGELNCGLTPAALALHCPLDDVQRKLLDTAIERLGLSARAYHRLLRVARTIADLDGCDHPQTRHLTEAIGYRVGIAASAP